MLQHQLSLSDLLCLACMPPNQRLHLTPLAGAEANGPLAQCKERDCYFKSLYGSSFRVFKRKSTFAAQVSRSR